MRGSLAIVVAALLGFGQALFAQRGGGIELHGVPGSVTSPGIDGRPRGVAASVTAPDFTKTLTSQGPPGSFAGHHHHRSAPVVAVPYYGYYAVPYYDYSAYDQSQAQPSPDEQQASQPQVIAATEEATGNGQGDSRYGEHSFDPVESTRESDMRNSDRIAQAQAQSAPPATTQDQEPPTTLVYRDGHKTEVRNYAIVGSNLIDLTKSPIMKKIPLSSLDLEATRRENEENGVDFHLP